MYKIIGKKGCSACEMTKRILTNKKIPFEYLFIEDLSNDDANKYLSQARKENKMSMPLIFKDNKMFNLQTIQ